MKGKSLILVTILALGTVGFAQGVGSDVDKAAKATGRVTEKAAKKVAHGGKKAAKGTEKAAKGTARDTEKAADKTADVIPYAKSIGASVAMRASSPMRYSGFSCSPLMRLRW